MNWIKLHVSKTEYLVNLDLGLVIEQYEISQGLRYSQVKPLAEFNDFYWDESPEEIMAMINSNDIELQLQTTINQNLQLIEKLKAQDKLIESVKILVKNLHQDVNDNTVSDGTVFALTDLEALLEEPC